MKRLCQTVLVAVAIVCALVLSASSTIELAASVGVPGYAHPFAVGLLEVASVAGTWLWLTEARLRWEAAAVVALSSFVTGAGGIIAYGAFGVVAPIGLILTVHLMARAWTAPATTSQCPVVELHQPEPAPATMGLSPMVELHQREPAPAPKGADSTRTLPPADLNQSEAGSGADLNQSEPGSGDDRRLAPVVDELDRVRAIVAQGGGRGTVADELAITPRQARTLIDKVKQETA